MKTGTSDAQIRALAQSVARRPLSDVPVADRAAVIAETAKALPTPDGMSQAAKGILVRESLMNLWTAANDSGHAASKQTAHSQGGNEQRPLDHADGTMGPMGVQLSNTKLSDGVHSMRELFAVDAGAAEKVLKTYHRHLKNAYPGKGEVEGPKTLQSYLSDHPNWDITLQVDKGRIVFGANTQRFDTPLGAIAVFEHMFAAKGHEAAAKTSVEDIVARHAAKGAVAVLTELNDPRLMVPEQLAQDALRPFARGDNIEFMKGLGFQAIDCPYGQPSFGKPGDEVIHLLSGLRVIDSSILTPVPNHLRGSQPGISNEAHALIVGGFFSTFDNLLGKDVNKDPTYAAIRRHVPAQVALLPLDAERSFLKNSNGVPRASSPWGLGD